MGAIIQIGKRKAILRSGEWRCCEPSLEARLNQLTSDWVKESGGPSLSAPDPDLVAAQAISRLLGGRVVAHIEARTRAVQKAWFSHRQLRLFTE
jgi:hypothetical protein